MEYVGNHKRNSEVEPLCSYPFTVMVFVLLCGIFMRGFAVGRDAWPPGLPARAAAPLPMAARHSGGNPQKSLRLSAPGCNGLCASIQPAQKLFVPLCVKNFAHAAIPHATPHRITRAARCPHRPAAHTARGGSPPPVPISLHTSKMPSYIFRIAGMRKSPP